MALKTINDTNLSAIAAAIREKNQTTTTYKPSEMANAIKAIPAGGGGGGSGKHSHTVATYKFAFTGNSSSWNVTEGTRTLDLTQFGVKEDLSNLVCLAFDDNHIYWLYHIQSGVDKSTYSYGADVKQKVVVENGAFKLKKNLYSIDDKEQAGSYLWIPSDATASDFYLYYAQMNHSSTYPVYFTKVYVIVEEDA